jgi:alcohol dehydrogenase class IV
MALVCGCCQCTLTMPKAIIFDAELTLHTPQRLWLSSGIRFVPFPLRETRIRLKTDYSSLDHAIETQYRLGAQYHIKKIAIPAIADLFKYLQICQQNPQDLTARTHLQVRTLPLSTAAYH